MRSFVGGGVAQHHQRLEIHQRIQRFATFHFLRLIQNQDRPVGADHVNGSAALKVIQLFVNAPRILARGIERLHVDHHHIDARVT